MTRLTNFLGAVARRTGIDFREHSAEEVSRMLTSQVVAIARDALSKDFLKPQIFAGNREATLPLRISKPLAFNWRTGNLTLSGGDPVRFLTEHPELDAQIKIALGTELAKMRPGVLVQSVTCDRSGKDASRIDVTIELTNSKA